MRLAIGPGRAVLIFGPATGIRVLVVMVFSCEMAEARRTCRISCLPWIAYLTLWDRAQAEFAYELIALTSRPKRDWGAPCRERIWSPHAPKQAVTTPSAD